MTGTSYTITLSDTGAHNVMMDIYGQDPGYIDGSFSAVNMEADSGNGGNYLYIGTGPGTGPGAYGNSLAAGQSIQIRSGAAAGIWVAASGTPSKYHFNGTRQR